VHRHAHAVRRIDAKPMLTAGGLRLGHVRAQ
jgi:hypothetical protein